MTFDVPVIHARPSIVGRIAGFPATVVTPAIVPVKREPMIDSWTIDSPTRIAPRACSTASRAQVPVPVGLRSERPGATMQVLRVTFPAPANGRSNWTMLTP